MGISLHTGDMLRRQDQRNVISEEAPGSLLRKAEEV